MKKLNLWLLLFIPFLMAACSTTKVFLVRHAEKAASPANDPILTDAGLQRAQDLAALLASKKIEAIYSTQTNRTLSTAEPLSKKNGLAVLNYKPDTAFRIVEAALKQKKNTLIVGHSNTLLPLLKSLGLSSSIKEIADNDYDNLFIIYRKQGKLQLLERTFGKLSPAENEPLAETKMK